MKQTIEEPDFEVVDDSAQPRIRPPSGRRQRRGIYALQGWKAVVLAVPIVAAVILFLIALGTAIAIAGTVGAVLLGAGWVVRKILLGSSSQERKEIPPQNQG